MSTGRGGSKDPADQLRSLLLVGVTTGVLILAATVSIIVIASSSPPPPGCCTIGQPFAVGNPQAVTCAEDSTYAANGCEAGDFTYNLSIEQSTVDIGNVHFQVIFVSNGSTVSAPTPGGFSVIYYTGALVAQSPQNRSLSMGSSFAFPGGLVDADSPLSTLYSILIDLGHGPGAAPDQGYALVATLVHGVTGSASLSLT